MLIFSKLFLFATLFAPCNLVMAQENTMLNVQSAEFWGHIVAIMGLVLCSGIVAGLTLGMMSQDTTNLSILAVAGSEKQKRHAAKIIPLRKNGHLLLTSLLLTNTVLNETLPILCDSLFGQGYVAVIISTALIVLFAEILPQAICSRHGLAIGAFFAIPVRILIVVWYIIAWPVAKVLDCLLGKHEGVSYSIPELRELIGLHGESSHLRKGPLQDDAVDLLRGMLDLCTKTAGDVAKPVNEKLLVHIDTAIDDNYTMLGGDNQKVFVYENCQTIHQHRDWQETNTRRSLMGAIDKKYLISVLSNRKTMRDVELEKILRVPSDTPIPTLLKMMHRETCTSVQVYHQSTGDHAVQLNAYLDNSGTAVVQDSYCHQSDNSSEQYQGSSSVSNNVSESSRCPPAIGIIEMNDILSYMVKEGSLTSVTVLDEKGKNIQDQLKQGRKSRSYDSRTESTAVSASLVTV